ncbi:MAG: hypothetical protein EOP87_12905, partial [Verrucomicrobiaceae bacterium]
GQGDGIRLHAEPSKEALTLRTKTKEVKNLEFKAGEKDPLADYKEDLFEIEAVIDAAGTNASEAGFRLYDSHQATWKPSGQTFSDMEGAQAPVDGKIHVRIFVDRVSMEVFVNGSYHARYIRQTPGQQPIRIISEGGAVKFDSLKVHTLRSVWE